MKLYEFKVALDHDKKIYRIIRILGNQTLDTLHNIIFAAFNREEEHLYSFYMTKKATKSYNTRYKAPEYTSDYSGFSTASIFDPGRKSGSAKEIIDALQLKENDVFYYLFDFGDSWWHEVTLLSIAETDNAKGYPKIVKKAGRSPKQYPEF